VLAKDGEFFVYEPDLAVIVSDADLETAYQRFLTAKDGYLAMLERAGIGTAADAGPSAHSAPAGGTWARHGLRSELTLFLAKMAIVLILIGAVGTIAVSSLGKAADRLASVITQVVAPIGQLSMKDMLGKAKAVVEDIRSLSPEEKEDLRRNIGIISRELDPVADAWRNPPPSFSTPGK
jgi:hypothetical protein